MLSKKPDNPITRICVIGAGNRGANLALQIKNHFPFANIVGVAERDKRKRFLFCQIHSLKDNQAFSDWENLMNSGLECDAAIISTMDNQHTEPALAALKKGWHLLLEKPMAHTLADSIRIHKMHKRSGKFLSVCHTLRYKPAYQKVKQIIEAGEIGDIVTIEHLEAIGNIRFTHNYVRGRWGNEQGNTFLLLHKSSHDIDFLSWLIGEECKSVTSYGGLKYFNSENAPKGSALRCTDGCNLEKTCTYSAKKLYVNNLLDVWPAKDISNEHTKEAHENEIKKGPYGLCVWRANNNVVDHQVVALEFEGGVTATFTMSGFTSFIGRQTRVHGTLGDLFFDEANRFIEINNFGNNSSRTIDFPESKDYHPEDKEIVGNWLEAIIENNPGKISVDSAEALKTHSIVFAAEKSRLESRIIFAPFFTEA